MMRRLSDREYVVEAARKGGHTHGRTNAEAVHTMLPMRRAAARYYVEGSYWMPWNMEPEPGDDKPHRNPHTGRVWTTRQRNLATVARRRLEYDHILLWAGATLRPEAARDADFAAACSDEGPRLDKADFIARLAAEGEGSLRCTLTVRFRKERLPAPESFADYVGSYACEPGIERRLLWDYRHEFDLRRMANFMRSDRSRTPASTTCEEADQ